MKHPSKDIIGTKSKALLGRKVILCVTGSVAAVRSPEIARTIMRNGAEVYTVMSQSAQQIIHPYLMEWATGNPVVTELTGKIEHVSLVGVRADTADLVIIAPATANTISKIATGIDDTTVTSVASTAIGSKTPILIVPAMHQSMYNHQILEKNIRKLKAQGIEFIGPKIEEEKAKIEDTEIILQRILHRIERASWFSGKRFLITSGPTVEHIDDVRIITNTSSGKMGAALAEEASYNGAEITYVGSPYGTISPMARLLTVETSKDMKNTVLKELQNVNYDVVIAAAAVSDWKPTTTRQGKLSTQKMSKLTLTLKPTEKIIDKIKKVKPNTFLVIFKAGYDLSEENLIENAFTRLEQAKADLVVANDVSKEGVGFRTDTNEVFIIDREKNVVHVPLNSKRIVAQRILEIVKKRMNS